MDILEKEERVEEYIDLKVYLKILNRWKVLIAAITLLALVTSGVLSFLVLPPVYESKAVIMVSEYQDPNAGSKNDQEQQDNLQSVVDSMSRLPQLTIKTYVGQITNEALMRQVIQKLKLDKTIYTPETLRNMVEVNNLPDTNLIEVTVKNNKPALAAKIANTISGQFMTFLGSNSEKKLVVSTDMLTKQLAEQNKLLNEASKNLNKQRSKIRNVTYLTQEIQNKTTNLSAFQSQALEIDVNYQPAMAGKVAAEQQLPSVPQTIKVSKLDVDGKLVQTEEMNPTYQDLTQTITQKNVELSELNAKKNTIRVSVDQLQRQLTTMQAELTAQRDIESQLTEKVNQTKQTRDVLAEKLTQVQIAKSVNLSQSTIQIVTPAYPQTKPVSPKKAMNLAIGLILGLMLGVGLALLLEMMNNTINKVEDIEEHLKLPVLGVIPVYRERDLN